MKIFLFCFYKIWFKPIFFRFFGSFSVRGGATPLTISSFSLAVNSFSTFTKKAPFEVFVIDESYKGAWVRSRCFTWIELCGVYRKEKPRIPVYTGQQTSLLAVGPLSSSVSRFLNPVR